MALFINYYDLFRKEENSKLLNQAIQCKEHFENAQVVNYSDDYPNWRKARVSFRDKELSEYYELLRRYVLRHYKEVCEKLNIKLRSEYDVEIQLTAHNDGDFFKQHRDASDNGINSNRILSFVYYFHKTPKPFTGGELVFYINDEAISIEPTNNMIIFFDPKILHEVKMVHCSQKMFENSRFTLNGWVKNK